VSNTEGEVQAAPAPQAVPRGGITLELAKNEADSVHDAAPTLIGDSTRSMLRHAPPDVLSALRPLLARMVDLQALLGTAKQVHVVLDTSVVLADIWYLAKNRTLGKSQPRLLDLLVSQTLIAYAPPNLAAEVEDKLPKFATRLGVDVAQLSAHWARYATHIRVVQASDLILIGPQSALAARDPKDVPFAIVARLTGVGILTRDTDYAGADVAVVPFCILVDLRTYARGKTVELLVVYGGLAITVPLIHGLKAIAGFIQRLPPLVKIAMVVSSLIYLSDADRRQRFLNRLGSITRTLAPIAMAAGAACLEMQQARDEYAGAWERVTAQLSDAGQPPARSAVGMPPSSPRVTAAPTAAYPPNTEVHGPAQATPSVSRFTSAEILAELARRERRVAKLLAEREHVIAAMNEIEAALDAIGE